MDVILSAWIIYLYFDSAHVRMFINISASQIEISPLQA